VVLGERPPSFSPSTGRCRLTRGGRSAAAPRTQEGYIRAVKSSSAFLGASPGTARFEDVRRYQLHLVSSGAGVPTINHTLMALRFLFMVTLRKPDVAVHLPFVREPRRLPVVLSPEDPGREARSR